MQSQLPSIKAPRTVMQMAEIYHFYKAPSEVGLKCKRAVLILKQKMEMFESLEKSEDYVKIKLL